MRRDGLEEILRQRLGLAHFDALFLRRAAEWNKCVDVGIAELLNHGGFSESWQELEALSVRPAHVELDTARPESTLDKESFELNRQAIERAIQKLRPWKKGPFSLGGLHIDAEWRSDLKWQRVLEHIGRMDGEQVLDVGTGNGYFLLRALGSGAQAVLGLEPSAHAVSQFLALQPFFPHLCMAMLPARSEDFLSECRAFDTVMSMGVLYHRKSPIEHLEQLKGFARPGGRVIVETIVIDGADGYSLVPEGRYANMRNVWFLPSVGTLRGWLKRLGLKDIQATKPVRTTAEEQRSTPFSSGVSLRDALDPSHPELTIEGHPAPQRVIMSARVPSGVFVPEIFVVAAAIVVGNRCLIGQRPPGGSFGGYWEFPGGKPEPRESPVAALVREISEELALDVRVERWLARGVAETLTHTIVVDTYLARPLDPSGPIVCREHQELRFIEAHEFDQYIFAPADLPALPALHRYIQFAAPAALPDILAPPASAG